MTTLICYRRCSTCRKLEQTLQHKGHSFEYREMDKENPTPQELARWHKQSGLPLKRFFNTSGIKYRELGLSKKLPGMTEEEQYALLATDGLLVKRPIVLTADQVYVGPDAVKWGDSL